MVLLGLNIVNIDATGTGIQFSPVGNLLGYRRVGTGFDSSLDQVNRKQQQDQDQTQSEYQIHSFRQIIENTQNLYFQKFI
jgi:hypothetical protein